MRTGLAVDARFRNHVPPGTHPERPSRITAIERHLEETGLRSRTVPLPVRPATRAELERAHAAHFLDALERRLSPPHSEGWIDPDTYYSPESWEVALLAAGATVEAARVLANREVDSAAVLVRPPGHHATRDRAMGFCLLNNVAVAAADLAAQGLRVAIVDFDVHHGNGTQDIFWEDGRVLYASSHQFPFYPGTGTVAERGAGAGLGATINVPLPAGIGDDVFLAAYERVILPAVERFRPDLVIASAGYDAHVDDPLGALQVTTAGFSQLAARLRSATDGRLLMALEGGYDLAALSTSVGATVAVLLGDAPEELVGPRRAGIAEETRELVLAARSLAELPPPMP